MNNQTSEAKIIKVAAAPYAAAAGAGMLVGTLFGIATSAIANGGEGDLKREGAFDVAKVSAQAWTQGVKIYWDDAAKLFTTVSTSNVVVGCAGAAAANPSATGNVILDGAVR